MKVWGCNTTALTATATATDYQTSIVLNNPQTFNIPQNLNNSSKIKSRNLNPYCCCLNFHHSWDSSFPPGYLRSASFCGVFWLTCFLWLMGWWFPSRLCTALLHYFTSLLWLLLDFCMPSLRIYQIALPVLKHM